jgi:hypothetical protein
VHKFKSSRNVVLEVRVIYIYYSHL